MSDSTREEESRQEAERLAVLPLEEQRKAVAIIRGPAEDPKVSKRDRKEAKLRAEALEKHLRRLNRQKKHQL